MSTYVVSDLHGNYYKFLLLLNKIKYNPQEDTMYILGNVVDNGPQPIELLKLIMNDKSMKMCAGKHEIAMLQAYLTKEFEFVDKWRKDMGGEITYNQYNALSEEERFSILDFIGSCPLYFSNDNLVMLSAGLLVNKTALNGKKRKFEEVMAEQSETTLYWIEEEFYSRPALEDRTVIFGNSTVQKIRGTKDYRLWFDKINEDKICVNSGVAIGGKLGCLKIETMEEFYV